MTILAGEKVNARIQSVIRARMRTRLGTPRLSAISNWREDAVAYFFSNYSIASEIVTNTTAILPGLCSSSHAGSCLKNALCAAAFANQANHLHLDWMAIEAHGAYGRALKSLAVALEDPVEALKDTTLATTYILSLYEVSSTPRLPCLVLKQKG